MVTYKWIVNDNYVYLDGSRYNEELPSNSAALSNIIALANSLSNDEQGFKEQYINHVLPALAAAGAPEEPYWYYYNPDLVCLPGICSITAELIEDDEVPDSRVVVDTAQTEEGTAVHFIFYNLKGEDGAGTGGGAGKLSILYSDKANPSTWEETSPVQEDRDYVGLSAAIPVTLKSFVWFRIKDEITPDQIYSKFKSFVFKRQVERPSKPSATEGSYDNPIPHGWSDGIPAPSTANPDEPIWFTSRTFASDGEDGGHQDPEWAIPQVLTDTKWMDYEYHDGMEDDAIPPQPKKDNPYSEEPDPNGWSNSATTDTVWMAMRKIENGEYAWDSWQIVRIKGERGDYITNLWEFYAVGTENSYPLPLPALEEDGKYHENEDWKEDVRELSFTEENRALWNYEVTKTSDNNYITSGPSIICINGFNGRSIVAVHEYYAVSNTISAAPDCWKYIASDTGETDTGCTEQKFNETWKESAETSSITVETPYLWNFESIEYDNGYVQVTTPVIIFMLAMAPNNNECYFDLDNEVEMIAVDSDHKTIESYDFSTGLHLYCGIADLGVDNLFVKDSAITEDVEYTISSGFTVEYVREDRSGEDYHKLNFHIDSGVTFEQSVRIPIVATGQLGDKELTGHTAEFRIVLAEGGEDAEIYRILPSVNAIKYHKENDGAPEYSPSAVSVTVTRKVGLGEPEKITITQNEGGEGLVLLYDIDEGGESGKTGTNIEIESSSITQYIRYTLTDEQGNLYDKETIPLLKDGTNGQNGHSVNIKDTGGPLENRAALDAITEKEDGDAYYVYVPANPNDPDSPKEIHLFVWYSSIDNPDGTKGKWVDCGNFKGDGSYLHIKYANPTVSTDQQAFYVDGIGYLKLTGIGIEGQLPGEQPGKYVGIYADDKYFDDNTPDHGTGAPYKWQKFEGEDGYGYEYIYTLTKDEEDQPTVPTATTNTEGKKYQDDDFVPDGWFDGPRSVTPDSACCWTVYRIKTDGIWGPFKGDDGKTAEQGGKAILYSRYAFDGVSINVRFHAKWVFETITDRNSFTDAEAYDICYVKYHNDQKTIEENEFYVAVPIGDGPGVTWMLLSEYCTGENSYSDPLKSGDGVTVPFDNTDGSDDSLPEGTTGTLLYIFNASAEKPNRWDNVGKYGGGSAYVHIKYAVEYIPNVTEWTDQHATIPYLEKHLILTNKMEPLFQEFGEKPGKYQGVYSDSDQKDSSDITRYKWSDTKGEDGIGYEYIYKLVYKDDVATKIPTVPTATTSGGKTWQDDDFVPIEEGWGDNVSSITAEYPRRYMCYRVKKDGMWQHFMGDGGKTGATDYAVLDAVYGRDGTSVSIKGAASKTYTASTEFFETTAVNGTIYCVYPCEYNGYSEAVKKQFGDFYEFDGSLWRKLQSVTDIKDGDSYTASITSGTETKTCLFIWNSTAGSRDPQGEFVYSGPLGANGKSAYLHMKYANEVAQGGDYVDYLGKRIWFTPTGNSFDEIGEMPGEYVGFYTDEQDDESLNITSYTWTRHQGLDGFGYEYIYQVDNYPNKENHIVPTATTSGGKTWQDDDFVPNGWTDNPGAISKTDRYRWMCYRIKNQNGQWSMFMGESGKTGTDKGYAILDANWGEDGITGDLSNEVDVIPLKSDYTTERSGQCQTKVTIRVGSTECTNYGFKGSISYKKKDDNDQTGITATCATDGQITVTYESGVTFTERTNVSFTVSAKTASETVEQPFVFTLIGEAAAAPGESPVWYSLVPFSNAIIYDPNKQKTYPSAFTCEVLMHSGSTTNPYTASAISEHRLWYTTADTTTSLSKGDWHEYNTTGVSTNGLEVGDVLTFRFTSDSAHPEDIQSMKDQEGIEVNSVGENGTVLPAVTVDFTNEMQGIGLSYCGQTLNEITATTLVNAWSGTTPLGISAITWDNEEKYSRRGITHSARQSADTKTFINNIIIPSGTTIFDTEVFEFTIISTAETAQQSYSTPKFFTISGVKAGSEGESPVLYEILPDYDYVTIDKNGNIDPTAITLTINQVIGEDRIDVTTEKLTKSGVTLNITDATSGRSVITSSTVTTSADVKNYRFVLWENPYTGESPTSGNKILDRESVPTVIDGSEALTLQIEPFSFTIPTDVDRKTTGTGTQIVKLRMVRGANTKYEDISSAICTDSFTDADVISSVTLHSISSDTNGAYVDADITWRGNVQIPENGGTIGFSMTANTGNYPVRTARVSYNASVPGAGVSPIKGDFVPDNVVIGVNSNYELVNDWTGTTKLVVASGTTPMTITGYTASTTNGLIITSSALTDGTAFEIKLSAGTGTAIQSGVLNCDVELLGLNGTRRYSANIVPVPGPDPSTPPITYQIGTSASNIRLSKDGQYTPTSLTIDIASALTGNYVNVNSIPSGYILLYNIDNSGRYELTSVPTSVTFGSGFSQIAPKTALTICLSATTTGGYNYYETLQVFSEPENGLPTSTVWLTPETGKVKVDSQKRSMSSATTTATIGLKIGNEDAIITDLTVSPAFFPDVRNSIITATTVINIDGTSGTLTIKYNSGSMFNDETYQFTCYISGHTSGDQSTIYTGQKVFTLYREINDLDYLKNVFEEGNVEAKKGAFLREFLAVYTGGTTDPTVVAFMNGSNSVASGTSEQGTLMLAAGTNGLSGANSANFRVYANGDLFANNAKLKGSITATGGSIGGINIYNGGISADTFNLTSGGVLTASGANLSGSITATGGSIGGILIGNSGITAGSGTNTFIVSSDGSLTATSATIKGSVSATTGNIGGINISDSGLSATNFSLTSAGTMNAKAGSFGMLNIDHIIYSLKDKRFNVPILKGSQFLDNGDEYEYVDLNMELSPFYLRLGKEYEYDYVDGSSTVTRRDCYHENLRDGHIDLSYYYKEGNNYVDYKYNAIETNGRLRMFAYNSGITSAITNAETRILINPRADNNGDAISVKQGMFGGFRPRTRIASTDTISLTEYDSVIVCQGAHTLILPDNAGNGQMYTIIKTGDETYITLSSTTANIISTEYRTASSSPKNQLDFNGLEFGQRRYIMFIWHVNNMDTYAPHDRWIVHRLITWT